MVTSPSSSNANSKADLRRLLIFRELGGRELAEIGTRLGVKLYAKGEEIIGQHEEDSGVYFILSGVVHITVFSEAGKEVAFRDLEAGDMFGELSAIDGQARSANAVAKTEARVGYVSAAQFWALLRDYPEANAATLRYLSGLVRDLSTRLYQFSAYAVNPRIQTEIVRLARAACPDGNIAVLVPSPNHAEIASRINTQREAVTKEISRLVRAGLIERAPGRLVIPDIAALERVAEDALA